MENAPKADHGQACPNHPGRKVQGCCHACREWLCPECLQEGPLHYYCRKPACAKALREETRAPHCPSCGEALQGGPEDCPGCGLRLEPVPKEGSDDLVTVMKFKTSAEAQLARTKLESEGIRAFVIDEYVGSYLSGSALGGVRLQTAGSQAQQALQILSM